MDKTDEIYLKSNLTKNQVLTYLGQKLKPDSPFYKSPSLFSIKGNIHVDHFMDAFNRTVAKSDVLQTVFIEQDGIPQAAVNQNVNLCQYEDFSHLSENEFNQCGGYSENKNF